MPEELQRDGRGRPTLLTSALAERICGMVRRGNYVDIAAEVYGVPRQTLFAWLKRGRSGRPEDVLYADFQVSLAAAQVEAEARDVDLLDDFIRGRPESVDVDGKVIPALEPNPALLIWRLERRYPSRWARRNAVAVEHQGTLSVAAKVDAMTAEQRAARIDELQRKRAVLMPKL